jgi:pyruvate,water dikinase
VKESLEYKETISFNYMKSYGLFRKYFLHLSRLFVNEGFYVDLEDIFYLTFDEIQKIVKENSFSSELNSKIIKRKQEILDHENVELPDVIYGDRAPILPKKGFILKEFSGIPASNGYYTGKSCVVKGVKDFSKIKNGDVVIIPFSDIGWAPIFAKAGAVVAESGGVLSHSAIITREYGIPCVVGVNGACQIGDKVKIHIDGFSGRITIE